LATDIGEERRVFHVAITRCSERVAVLANSDEPSPFIGELEAPGEPAPVRAPRDTARTAEKKKPVDGKLPRIPAEVGMTIAMSGGVEGTIVEMGERSVVLSAGKARMAVNYGTEARIHGRMVVLAAPLDEATQTLVNALKDWRRSAAAEARIPAYTVLHDAHIESIAQHRPETLEELGRCKGIGASKLERWGDEILAALEEAGTTTAA
jgi:hypothetical protein